MERRPAMAGSACQTAWSWLIADPARISSLRLRDWPCAATSGFWKRQSACRENEGFRDTWCGRHCRLQTTAFKRCESRRKISRACSRATEIFATVRREPAPQRVGRWLGYDHSNPVESALNLS